jgi:hypothetical protein
MTKKPTLGEIIVMAGGALTLIFSFFPWISGGGESVNAWSTTKSLPSMFLWATWVPILAIIIGGFYALKVFAGGLPERVWDYSWDQLAFIAGLYCALITLGLLVADKSVAHTGWALILSFLTSLAIVVGAVLDKLGVGADIVTNVGSGIRSRRASRQKSGQQLGSGQPWSQPPSYGEEPPTSYPPPESSPPPTQPAPAPPPRTPPTPDPGETSSTEPPPGTTGF